MKITSFLAAVLVVGIAAFFVFSQSDPKPDDVQAKPAGPVEQVVLSVEGMT